MTYRYTYMAWFFFYFLYILSNPLRAKMILTTKSDPAIQSRSPLLAYFIPFLTSPSSYNIMFLFNLNSIMIQVSSVNRMALQLV